MCGRRLFTLHSRTITICRRHESDRRFGSYMRNRGGSEKCRASDSAISILKMRCEKRVAAQESAISLEAASGFAPAFKRIFRCPPKRAADGAASGDGSQSVFYSSSGLLQTVPHRRLRSPYTLTVQPVQKTCPNWKNHFLCPVSPTLPPTKSGPTTVSARTPAATSLGNLLSLPKSYIFPNS